MNTIQSRKIKTLERVFNDRGKPAEGRAVGETAKATVFTWAQR